MKEFEGEVEALESQYGIVAWAFVANEGVGRVDFVPGVVEVGFFLAGADLVAAFEGDVGILTAENHEELAFDVGGSFKGAIVAAFAKGA